MKLLLKRFLSDEAGLEPVEYALMAVLVVLVMIAGGIYMANTIWGSLHSVGDAAEVAAVTPTAAADTP